VGVFDMLIPAKTQVLKANNPCSAAYVNVRMRLKPFRGLRHPAKEALFSTVAVFASREWATVLPGRRQSWLVLRLPKSSYICFIIDKAGRQDAT